MKRAKYRRELWDSKRLFEFYRKVGWTPNRMNIVRWALDCFPESILEIGCLDGCYIEKLRLMGYKGGYLGVDVARRHLKAAAKLHPRERFQFGDIRNLMFHDGEFDLVMLSDVIQHLSDHKKPIAEALRVARRFVLVSVYGSYDKPFARDSKKSLSRHYTRENIEAEIVGGWRVADFRSFPLPAIGKVTAYVLFQFKVVR